MAKGDRPLRMSPGIIKGRKYSVVEPIAGSYHRPVLKGRTYAVGQLDTEMAFGSRVWSYMMERYTTCKALKRDIVDEEAVGESVTRGIEDLRILSLVLAGKTNLPDFAVQSLIQSYKMNRDQGYAANPGNVPMAALLYLAHHGVHVEKEMAPMSIRFIQPELDRIADFVRRDCTDPKVTAVAAEMFMKLFTEASAGRKIPIMGKSALNAHFRAWSSMNPYLTLPGRSAEITQTFGMMKGFMDSYEDSKRIEGMIREEQKLSGMAGVSTTNFSIVELPMPIVHHREKTRGYMASDFGVVPRYISRYMWGPMFTVRAKGKGGGTVLIDNSGSMSFRASEIAQMVHDVPAATIASYNGNGLRGTMFILAKGGKMATPEAIGEANIGCGNIVDYQSLLWLRMQRHPRIWITDGGVTGAFDRSYPHIRDACDELVKKHRIIKILEDVEEIIRIMKGGRM